MTQAPPTAQPATPRRGVLLTSFEPSGDDHASAVIAELKRRHPDLVVYAWGGPKMERAGAVLVERTGENAVMGMPGLGKILEHIRLNRRVRKWLREHAAPAGPVVAHIPVDSPAANFPICKIAKGFGLKVVHLVAPQVWAWGRWRIKKLRRLTDFVLCLLPFEENWFITRGVQARFVGHPLFDEPLDYAELDRRAAEIERRVRASLGETHGVTSSGARPPLRLALMPGSRPAEYRGCFPVLLDAFERLRKDFPNVTGVVAATKPSVAEEMFAIAAARAGEPGAEDPEARRARRNRAAAQAASGEPERPGWPAGLEMVSGDTDAVVRWCDFALVVSGTVTLQIARQSKPMVAFYRPNPLVYWLAARWLVSTEFFTLPNLIAGRRILPELIPHFGDGEALAVEVIKLLRREGYADDQRAELAKVCELFGGRVAAHGAAEQIERVLGLDKPRSIGAD
ncbi:MAG TPA: hypothetical protein PL072_00700 [Phycisphaerales bacterium]|nr:hypothetical protein [Phycisphaerales bacterium]